MVSRGRKAEIRQAFKRLRLDAGSVTQIEVEQGAKLLAGRYWKIENAVVSATDEERQALAKFFKVSPDEIPTLSAARAVA
jgi:hypothetical protein